MLLLVGLGNPGSDYADNRHNIGFMAVDAIVRRHGFRSFRKKFHGLLAEGEVGGERVIALKPLTYMNESGRSVLSACSFFKISTKNVLVMHDELDLAGGKLRVKRGGGHAGHNGLRSIQGQIGADFRRVRMGIGHPGDKAQVTGHVLKDFSREEEDTWVYKMLDAIADNFPRLVDGDDPLFMNNVALALQLPKPKRPKPGDPEDTTSSEQET